MRRASLDESADVSKGAAAPADVLTSAPIIIIAEPMTIRKSSRRGLGGTDLPNRPKQIAKENFKAFSRITDAEEI